MVELKVRACQARFEVGPGDQPRNESINLEIRAGVAGFSRQARGSRALPIRGSVSPSGPSGLQLPWPLSHLTRNGCGGHHWQGRTSAQQRLRSRHYLQRVRSAAPKEGSRARDPPAPAARWPPQRPLPPPGSRCRPGATGDRPQPPMVLPLPISSPPTNRTPPSSPRGCPVRAGPGAAGWCSGCAAGSPSGAGSRTPAARSCRSDCGPCGARSRIA